VEGKCRHFIPGDGWMVTHIEADGGRWSQKVIAWAFNEDGEGVPITCDDSGAAIPCPPRDGELRAWHPDLAPPAFNGIWVSGRPDEPEQS